MRTTVPTIAAAMAGMFLFTAAPAHAGPRAWVSSTGGGIACTRAAPCATFTDAIAVVDAGGEINCVDAADYGPIADFPKSVTIDCTETGATIGQSSMLGSTAVRGTTMGVAVTLRGLSIIGRGLQGFGIEFTSSGELHVERCRISGFGLSASGGILIDPSTGSVKAYVSDTVIQRSGDLAAIEVVIFGTASAVAVFDRVQVTRNRAGIFAVHGDQTTGGPAPGTLSVQIRDSLIAENVNAGIRVEAGPSGVPIGVTVDNVTVANNASGFDINPGSFVTLGRTAVMGNQMGLTSSGGSFFSYGDNQLTGNVVDRAAGVTVTPLTLQ